MTRKSQFLAGIKAAEGYIKERGGWGGRTVQLVQCQSPGDPASDLKCYHDFIGSQTVAAMGLLEKQPDYLPLLVKAQYTGVHAREHPFGGTVLVGDFPAWNHRVPTQPQRIMPVRRGYSTSRCFQQDLPTAAGVRGRLCSGDLLGNAAFRSTTYICLWVRRTRLPTFRRWCRETLSWCLCLGQAAPITTFLNAFSAAGFPIDGC